MLKKIVKILPIFILFIYGCNDDFLEVQPSDRLSTEQLGQAAEFNPEIIKGGVAGLYQLMYLPGTGGFGGDDDFGQKGIDIWTDMLSADIAHSETNYGWYSTFSNLQASVDFTNRANYMAWRYYYRIIRAANKLIGTLGGNDITPEAQANRHYMGQAKAMRAYAYFYLVQLYTDRYDPTQEVLPIYNSAEKVEGVAKSTMEEVYNLIYSDLNDALSLLSDFNRTAKSQINTDVVKMLLAYAYASEDKNWDQVKSLTADVINTGSYPILAKAQALDGMNFISTPGWIWASDITIDDSVSLASFYSQMDYFTYGYASVGNSKSIDASLYAEMPADDVRRDWFRSSDLINWRKYYDPARQWDGQRPVITDVFYMRIAEVYLLHAEAALKADGDAGAARGALKTVVSERVNDASYIDGLSTLALTSEITLQTRLELWGEGKAYLLKRRNKMDIVRGSNHLIFVGDVMSYDDNRLSFEIPQAEILNNPFISTQN
ncbi:SusD/RagB family lipoprotein precursor [Tenacibaculum sp. 190130A14a]|uniref:Starch-binding outer membrane protein, SusD/RagB family n=1 Tax=Tenacibaculum polynesiense TaxID=3137857 RepID=A0ABM9P8R1_9FLAO